MTIDTVTVVVMVKVKGVVSSIDVPDVVINSAFVKLEIVVVISAAVVDDGKKVELSVGKNDEAVVIDVVLAVVSNFLVGVAVSFEIFSVD